MQMVRANDGRLTVKQKLGKPNLKSSEFPLSMDYGIIRITPMKTRVYFTKRRIVLMPNKELEAYWRCIYCNTKVPWHSISLAHEPCDELITIVTKDGDLVTINCTHDACCNDCLKEQLNEV